MENASFVGEGRTGATSDSPARNGIRRSATPCRRTAPPLRTTGCLNEPESTLPILAFRLSSPKSARARAHHSELGSPDSSRVRKPIDLCGSFGRIRSPLGLLRISGRHSLSGRVVAIRQPLYHRTGSCHYKLHDIFDRCVTKILTQNNCVYKVPLIGTI